MGKFHSQVSLLQNANLRFVVSFAETRAVFRPKAYKTVIFKGYSCKTEVLKDTQVFFSMKEAELRRILSSNIKHYRSLRGWPQVKLAEEIGISTNFLADIETGKSWVSSLTLVKLANCFGIEVYELFRPENAPSDEIQQAVKSLVNDISVTFEHSLGQISKKYLA